jgi:hypothetical protein
MVISMATAPKGQVIKRYYWRNNQSRRVRRPHLTMNLVFNTQHTVGANRVSSTAIVYDEFTTFETLVEGPDFPPEVDETGWEFDRLHGHSSFEDMVGFHQKMLENLERETGFLRQIRR